MNKFGEKLVLKIWGGSHEPRIGFELKSCPKNLSITSEDFEKDLSRRKPGLLGTTKRIENDQPIIISGIENNLTNGKTIKIEFTNSDIRKEDYQKFIDIPRPGHADFVAYKKYGKEINLSGGGFFSGRMTLLLVAAGVIAKKIVSDINFKAELISVNGNKDIVSEVQKAVEENDSVGGIVECTISNVPIGLGEPFFNSVESKLSHLVFSIPGVKGIEFGSGFKCALMKGSEHNDVFINAKGLTKTNNAGGINGGLTNGNNIVFRVAIKPTSSISKTQKTFNFTTNQLEELTISGRHDTCIALRMPVIIEAVSALVLADFLIQLK